MIRQHNALDVEKLQAIIIDALEDVKAQDITILNTEQLSGEFDRVIIATGSSNRQTRALAKNVHEQVTAGGGDLLATDGEDSGE